MFISIHPHVGATFPLLVPLPLCSLNPPLLACSGRVILPETRLRRRCTPATGRGRLVLGECFLSFPPPFTSAVVGERGGWRG